jgi:hypothetical protein
MDRREFLAKAGLVATWAGIAIHIADCGEEDGGTGPGGDNSGDVTGTVSNVNYHTHSGAVVTAAQITAGQAVTLTLTGSGHVHTASLTAQEVMDIGAGTRVSKTSSNDDGHAHQVTFN